MEKSESSMVFYESWYRAMKRREPELFKEVMMAILEYGLYGQMPENLSQDAEDIFILAEPNLTANIQRRENGKKGGRPSKNHRLSDVKTIGYENQKPNVNVNVNENENEKKKGRSFVKPSVQEVSDYCRERNNNVDARAFVDFYESKGWLIGKEKMKDWKAAVRTWERRQSGTKFNDIHNNAYDFDDLESKLMAN